jgi:hypothetical protein
LIIDETTQSFFLGHCPAAETVGVLTTLLI